MNMKAHFIFSLLISVASSFGGDTSEHLFRSGRTRSRSTNSLGVMTLNFACRGSALHYDCDNCEQRFKMLADALVKGETDADYENVPDLDEIDVILGQELAVEPAKFSTINEALLRQGFLYSTGAPLPTLASPKCRDPPSVSSYIAGEYASAFGVQTLDHSNGGLVTWSRYPIRLTQSQRWCAHGMPLPAGFLTTAIEVDGRLVVVTNHHMFPSFSDYHNDLRTYQFGELRSLFKEMASKLSKQGQPFSIVIGGDFNEDAYGKQKTTPGVDCSQINDPLVLAKFATLNLDLVAACQNGMLGKGTWDTSTNDLAKRFSSSDKFEALDYVILHSDSTTASDPPPLKQTAGAIRRKTPWKGSFCDNGMMGWVGGSSEGVAHALTDHHVVTASVTLPPRNGEEKDLIEDATAIVQSVLNPESEVDGFAGACGQESSFCLLDGDCCGDGHRWNTATKRLACVNRKCVSLSCEPVGASCTFEGEGSACCGFTKSDGAYCAVSTGVCTRKHSTGEGCMLHSQCQSGDCGWTMTCN